MQTRANKQREHALPTTTGHPTADEHSQNSSRELAVPQQPRADEAGASLAVQQSCEPTLRTDRDSALNGDAQTEGEWRMVLRDASGAVVLYSEPRAELAVWRPADQSNSPVAQTRVTIEDSAVPSSGHSPPAFMRTTTLDELHRQRQQRMLRSAGDGSACRECGRALPRHHDQSFLEGEDAFFGPPSELERLDLGSPVKPDGNGGNSISLDMEKRYFELLETLRPRFPVSQVAHERRPSLAWTTPDHEQLGHETELQRKSSSRLRETSLNDGYYKNFFREIRKLGRGGFGSVYLCQHELDGEALGTYAVKKIPVGDNHEWLVKVLREVRALEAVKHPNVVDYKHSWLEKDQPTPFGPSDVPCCFILMEYADRGNLADLIFRHGRTLTDDEVVDFFLQIALGLQHLHHAGVIYHDLKPENVLIKTAMDSITRTQFSRLLLSDFGTSALFNSEAVLARRSGASGTLQWMAPEVICKLRSSANFEASFEWDQKADIWALGACLFAMSFGVAPFPTTRGIDQSGDAVMVDAEEDVVARICTSDRVQAPNYPERPEALRNLIYRLMDPDPDQRPYIDEVLEIPYLNRASRNRPGFVGRSSEMGGNPRQSGKDEQRLVIRSHGKDLTTRSPDFASRTAPLRLGIAEPGIRREVNRHSKKVIQLAQNRGVFAQRQTYDTEYSPTIRPSTGRRRTIRWVLWTFVWMARSLLMDWLVGAERRKVSSVESSCALLSVLLWRMDTWSLKRNTGAAWWLSCQIALIVLAGSWSWSLDSSFDREAGSQSFRISLLMSILQAFLLIEHARSERSDE
ncbi:putative serine/threonine-protein kinase iksA [Porphyridium purpureum]|uniref:non-specific serine/threonine protein kinase n=1 Tax=Porphyridium purpureum TaxID=35688 RepID=A0A5J4Z6K3_PORPP|nr:putative serine/threonine-protein kinase iksA [Porphyridium purpureum]|eukprot:POR2727..scf295_1